MVRRLLLAADLGAIVLAVLATELVAGGHDKGHETIVLLATLPGWIAVANLYGLYHADEGRTAHATTDELASLVQMVTVGSWLLWIGLSLAGLAEPSVSRLVTFWSTAIALVVVARVGARAAARRRTAYLQNAVIVGAGDVGQLIARKLLQHPEYGVNLVGFVDDEPKERRAEVAHIAVLGGAGKLPSLVRLFDVERVIVAFSRASHAETIELIRALRGLGVRVDVVPRLFEIVGPRAAMHSVEGLPLVSLPPAKSSRTARATKRAVDLAGAVAGLLLTAPLFAYAAWRIKRESPGPVFFHQRRLGLGMREFTALKFRTMKAGTDDGVHRAYIRQTMSADATPNENGIYKLARADAVTPFGQWLRKTSLDELPQLLNVLRGEMSLVGPRPCIPYETEAFELHHFDRFLVPPGITGLWQVTARAHSTFGEALEMDVAYARDWSLKLDLELIVKTPPQLVRTRGTA
jgi:exopolysaccharide biosynthesis polyprenyl glycosylphosphotransferase